MKIGYFTKQEMLEKKDALDTVFIQSMNNQGYRCYYSFKDWYNVLDDLPTNPKLPDEKKSYRYVYEIIKYGYPCKPYLDIDYYITDSTDEVNIKKELVCKLKQEIVNIFCKSYNYILDEKYILVFDSSGQKDNKYKLSFRVIVSTPDQLLFKSNKNTDESNAFHLAKLLSENNDFANMIDLSVYTKDREMRTLGSCKSPDDKREFVVYGNIKPQFKDCLITWYDLTKPHKFIETPHEEQKHKIVELKMETVKYEAINDNITKLLEDIFHDYQFTISKEYKLSDNDIRYYYSSDICFNCCKSHGRKNTTSISITSTIHNLIEIKFHCWQNAEKSIKFYICRNNVNILKCNINFDVKIFNNMKSTKLIKFIELAKMLGFDKLNNVFIADGHNLLTNGTIEKDHLTENDIYHNNKTIFVKSYEETNKTGSMIDIIKSTINNDPNYKDFVGKKFIILACHIATLSGIRGRIEQENTNLAKQGMNTIKYLWYAESTQEQLLSDSHDVLIITLNSLLKLLDIDNDIINPEKYILWNDETNALIQYIQNPGTFKNRFNCLTSLKILIERSYKCYFTCADLTLKIIKLIMGTRKGEYTVIQNTKTKKHRVYNMTESKTIFEDALLKSFNNNETFCILCDSKKQSDYYYYVFCHMFEKHKLKKEIEYIESFPQTDKIIKCKKELERVLETEEQYYEIIEEIMKNNTQLSNKIHKQIKDYYFNKYKEIMLINKDNNNGDKVLSDLNSIIRENKVKILICSPSLGIGINVDLKRDNDMAYFDRLFAHAKGNSLIAKGFQQMLNRIRHFTYNEHYILCDKITKKTRVTDEELFSRITQDIKKNYNGIIRELRLRPNDKSDFYHNIYVRSVIDKNMSDMDFKSELIKEINSRGHTVNIITSLDSKKVKIQVNNINKYEYKEIIERLELEKIEDIISCRLISEDTFNEYTYSVKKGHILSQKEAREVQKFVYYKKYNIIEDVEINDVIKFIDEYARKFELYDQLQNILTFVIDNNINKRYDRNEIDEINVQHNERHKWIDKLLKLIGFSGVLDTSVLETVNKITLTKNELNYIRMIFRSLGDIGRLSGEQKPHTIALWISRLLNSLYGMEVKSINVQTRINGKPVRINKNYCIRANDLIIEYLVLKYPQKASRIPFDENCEFKFSHIHGVKGTYGKYIKSKIVEITKQNKFIDSDDEVNGSVNVNPLDYI